MTTPNVERLRAGAINHDRCYGAALELLVWLGKSIPVIPMIFHPDDVMIDAEQLAYNSGAWSGGERRVVAVALSLLGHEPVMLEDVLLGLGSAHRAAVLEAITAAAGAGTFYGGDQ